MASMIAPPIEWQRPNQGCGQDGPSTSSTKALRSRSNKEKSSIWPLRGFFNCRAEPPCPRQSMVATAKPRASNSAITSKYFSMNSDRPCSRTTVPRTAVCGTQRAVRSCTPSTTRAIATMASGGAGLSWVETRCIKRSEIARGPYRAFFGEDYARDDRLRLPAFSRKREKDLQGLLELLPAFGRRIGFAHRSRSVAAGRGSQFTPGRARFGGLPVGLLGGAFDLTARSRLERDDRSVCALLAHLELPDQAGQ